MAVKIQNLKMDKNNFNKKLDKINRDRLFKQNNQIILSNFKDHKNYNYNPNLNNRNKNKTIYLKNKQKLHNVSNFKHNNKRRIKEE